MSSLTLAIEETEKKMFEFKKTVLISFHFSSGGKSLLFGEVGWGQGAAMKQRCRSVEKSP